MINGALFTLWSEIIGEGIFWTFYTFLGLGVIVGIPIAFVTFLGSCVIKLTLFFTFDASYCLFIQEFIQLALKALSSSQVKNTVIAFLAHIVVEINIGLRQGAGSQVVLCCHFKSVEKILFFSHTSVNPVFCL